MLELIEFSPFSCVFVTILIRSHDLYYQPTKHSDYKETFQNVQLFSQKLIIISKEKKTMLQMNCFNRQCATINCQYYDMFQTTIHSIVVASTTNIKTGTKDFQFSVDTHKEKPFIDRLQRTSPFNDLNNPNKYISF